MSQKILSLCVKTSETAETTVLVQLDFSCSTGEEIMDHKWRKQYVISQLCSNQPV